MSSFDVPGVLSPTQKTLIRAWWKKVASNPKPNNASDNTTDSSNGHRVFGIPLTESIRYAHSSISYVDASSGMSCYGIIPTVVAKCGAFLKEQGLMVEGVFRISGSSKRIGMLQTVFDESEDFGAKFKWEGDFTVHDAANVMRRFLNHLPEPVITLDHYRAFKNTMNDEFPSLDAKIQAFQNLILSLPLVHQYLLLYIMDMLGLFSMTKDKTRMDVSALAAVFAPGVLSHPDDELNPAGYKESQRVLEFLIEHQQRFAVPRSCIPPNQTLVPRESFSATIPRRRKQSVTPSTSTSTGRRHQHVDLSRILVDLQKHGLGEKPRAAKLQRSSTTVKTKQRSPFSEQPVSQQGNTTATTSNLKRSQSVPSKRYHNREAAASKRKQAK
ncbi:hypothetical protein O0I10_004568 [Lichtheimia ornata]|uniref:Rho-GAP domain-containing protein n=1 Tax=Lichtheimia ornata TaxID=688661 RepID=A0AAD7V687_9FUNG|nr:uncharacterized protein O0I10_004568 [Lichtheimia ornata]KAJ8659590.1 hypothetical protein O0I10_004568 [Lichtheimia ornata]